MVPGREAVARHARAVCPRAARARARRQGARRVPQQLALAGRRGPVRDVRGAGPDAVVARGGLACEPVGAAELEPGARVAAAIVPRAVAAAAAFRGAGHGVARGAGAGRRGGVGRGGGAGRAAAWRRQASSPARLPTARPRRSSVRRRRRCRPFSPPSNRRAGPRPAPRSGAPPAKNGWPGFSNGSGDCSGASLSPHWAPGRILWRHLPKAASANV
jgi:hypothetical protein